MHPLVRQAFVNSQTASESSNLETLYVSFDPKLMAKEDVVEFLEALNAVYAQLGGDELIIREDEIGQFSQAGVLV